MKQPYITWIQFEDRGLTPECARGDDWDSLRCPETGVFLVKFTKIVALLVEREWPFVFKNTF